MALRSFGDGLGHRGVGPVEGERGVVMGFKMIRAPKTVCRPWYALLLCGYVLVCVVAVISALVAVGSCVLNDYFDLRIDAINKPEVPPTHPHTTHDTDTLPHPTLHITPASSPSNPPFPPSLRSAPWCRGRSARRWPS